MLKRISLCVTSSLVLACAPAAHAHIVDNVLEHSAPNAALQLTPIGSHESGVLGKSTAEIVAYYLSLIHISEPTRRLRGSRMPSSA